MYEMWAPGRGPCGMSGRNDTRHPRYGSIICLIIKTNTINLLKKIQRKRSTSTVVYLRVSISPVLILKASGEFISASSIHTWFEPHITHGPVWVGWGGGGVCIDQDHRPDVNRDSDTRGPSPCFFTSSAISSAGVETPGTGTVADQPPPY